MANQEYHKDDFTISTDKSRLQLKVIQDVLKESYWADNIPVDMVKTAIENSIGFGLYHYNQQIGFARVVTDFSTIAYVADFFILDGYEKDTLSDWLMECICSYPGLETLRRWLLASKDGMYAPFRFDPLEVSIAPQPQDTP